MTVEFAVQTRRVLRVKNLQPSYHSKDRRPPWVRLPTHLLEDPGFASLSDAAKGHALLLLILVGRIGNDIPEDNDWVGRMIGAKEAVRLENLLESGYLEVSS